MKTIISWEPQTITYTQSNKIATLIQDTKDLTISYGFNVQRIHTIIKENSINSTEIYYIASANMEIVNGTEITYLYTQGQPFALHKKNSETETINYLHLDYQGSVMAITDQSGTLQEERNGVYPERSRRNVWGRPRTPGTLEYVLPNPFCSLSVVKRGYTFHEHLEEFNLINMNGRIYDPVLARFLNADPLLQDNTDGQNYNRYSYVLNNPTKYTDPSGYAYNGFKASNDNGASSTSFISDATEAIENDYKGRIKLSYYEMFNIIFGSGGGSPSENEHDFTIPVVIHGQRPARFSGVSMANLQASFGDYTPYYQQGYKYSGSSNMNEFKQAGLSDGVNTGLYLMGTITSAYEGHLSSATKTLEKTVESAYAYKRAIQSTINVNKTMLQVSKIAGKTFFVSGLVMTGIDIYQKGGSKSSIGWGLLDTGMGMAGFVPGLQLLSGIYFTGRIGYQMYESYQKP